MSDRTCIEGGCTSPAKARMMCARHYNAAYSAGLLAPLPKPPRHSLSDVDVDRATATCSVCGPVDIQVRSDRGTHQCKTVRRANSQGNKRSNNLRFKYGITELEYRSMFDSQEGLCSICGAPSEKRLMVDHDHQTGAVRELLCRHCNFALGFLKDDIRSAIAAADYLIRHATP